MRWQPRLSPEISRLVSFGTYLSGFTTLGVGGPAEFLARPETQQELSMLLAFSGEEGIPFWILGGGSNVLVSDKGLSGIIIQTGKLNGICWEQNSDAVLVTAESGAYLAALVGLSIKHGWSGLEFAAGIPGSIGGAIAGNAGVEDFSIGDLIRSVKIIDTCGKIIEKPRKDLLFSYRYSSLGFSGDPIVSCCLVLQKNPPAEVAEKVRYFLSSRKSQPRGLKTAGCIFKNPQGNSAGKLLDQAGCKGLSCGDAVVSSLHANFIENRGAATANDILKLISCCKERVMDFSGISLDREIRFLSNDRDAENPR